MSESGKPRTLDLGAVTRRALWAREIEAYLALPFAVISHVGPDVQIHFSSSIAAEEFHKLLTQKGRVKA